jgi:hypothetical protein
MRSSTRTSIVITLTLAAVLALAALSSPAGATSGTSKATQVRANVHTIQVALQSWVVDHNDHWPRYVSGIDFRNELKPYIDGAWPTNPYTHRPMRRMRTAGNYSYWTYSQRTTYRLIGWGSHHRRIISVPQNWGT